MLWKIEFSYNKIEFYRFDIKTGKVYPCIMDEIIKDFKKDFYRIRDLGYIKAINNDNSGIGLTFEHLIGKQVDNYPLPDYKNTIEIKTKLAYSKRPIHLFTLSPEGENFCEAKKLLNKYGYYSRNNIFFKKFNGTVYANTLNNIGWNNYFSLSVNYKEEKIVLLIYDKNKQLIDDSTFWSFPAIENALIRKLKYLALIQVWSTKRKNIKYYKYYKYNIYKLSNIITFIRLIEEGIISITFSIGVINDKKRFGQMHNHGTTFDINKENLERLFFLIE